MPFILPWDGPAVKNAPTLLRCRGLLPPGGVLFALGRPGGKKQNAMRKGMAFFQLRQAQRNGLLQSDFDIDTSRQIQTHEGVDGHRMA